MKNLFARLGLLLFLCVSASGAEFVVGNPVEVLWSGHWYKAKVIALEEGKWRISYDGYGSNWDESVSSDRIRALDAPAALGSGSEAKNTRIAAATTTAVPGNVAPPAAAKEIPRFAFPSSPAGARAGIKGAYLRVVSWYFNGRISLTNEGWFFTENGRVSLTPTAGLKFADFKTTQVAHASDGVYRIEGDTLKVTWANGSKPSSYSFEKKKDGTLVIDGSAATPVEGFSHGWRVDANYEGGASISGGGSYLASSNSLYLHRDGTFGGDSIGSISASSGGTSVGAGSSSSTSGTYEFDDHTLTLKHADGRVETRTVFAFSDKNAEGAPAYIWREGTILRRRDATK